ncbi:zinc finger protein 813 isoform X2 [Procambarus clarkii]|nr:zinc finger protein 184-like isoform X2 [Procambarus clarkii]XP_045583134.1 zinc finger protein 184-like isoform X2 [Procambarus clarkii]
MISKLKDIIENLKNDVEKSQSSAPQVLHASEGSSDNESSEESLENSGDGNESLGCQKMPNSSSFVMPADSKPLSDKHPSIDALVDDGNASGMVLSPNIVTSTSSSALSGAVLPTSFSNTFSTAPETHSSQISGITDPTTILTSSLNVEQSLCDTSYGDQAEHLKCMKCGAELPVDDEAAYCSMSNCAILHTCPRCCSIADSVSKRRRRIVEADEPSVSVDLTGSENKSSETPVKKHTCEKCGRVFSKWKHLSIHYTKVHLDEDGGEVGHPELLGSNTLPLYCCKTCNLACLSVQRFNTHTCRLPTDDDNTTSTLSNRILITNVLKLHKLRKFVCETCGVEYRTFKRITYHLPRCSPGPYPCNVCALLFTTQKELNYHKKKLHKDEKCFVCEECGKSFQRRTSLQKHAINWHESNSAMGPFKCELCPKKFIRRIYLTNHKLRMHGLDKKFLCQVCGNKFMTQNSLMAHMEVHNEHKRFECTFCKKKFKRKEKLKYHERIHTGERPFHCQLCVRGFVSKTKLDEHVSRHRGDRRYRCSYCTKTYAGAWDLKQHVRKVHDKLCEKVAVTVVAPNQTSTGNSALTQVQVLDPLAIATAASGLKEEEGVTCGSSMAHSHTQGNTSSATLEEVGSGLVGAAQYITVSGQPAVTIPVVGSIQGHIPPLGHVVQVSGSTVPLAGVGTAIGTGGTSMQTVQTVQAVQTIPGVTATEYSVQTLPPQAVHTTQGYIFTQGFDMVSGTLQY